MIDNDKNDLLRLIGSSIQNLSCCIELFEDAQQKGGVQRLTAVLADIDGYLKAIDTDPIIRLASVDRQEIIARLKDIETELDTIVSELGGNGQKPIT